LFCTNCGSSTEPSWSFCKKCGTGLQNLTPPPPEPTDDVAEVDQTVVIEEFSRGQEPLSDGEEQHSVSKSGSDSGLRQGRIFFVLASSLVVLFAGAVLFQGTSPTEPITSTPTASASTAVSQSTFYQDRGCRALDDANREVDLWAAMILTTEKVPDIYWSPPYALVSASDAVYEEFSQFLELMAVHYSTVSKGVNAGNHSWAKEGLQDYLRDMPKATLFCNGSVWIGELSKGEGFLSHTVGPGESLREIARQYGVPLDDLLELNGLFGANKPRTGEVLRIPIRATATDTTSPEPTSEPSQSQTASTLSSYDCAVVESNITMVRTVFTEGTATPPQIAAVLQGAASKWDVVAANQSGSRASWLSKMSELSLDLRGYILNGSPTNGEQLLDQLGNNFNLSAQFCG
jgi:LysM repeat protein